MVFFVVVACACSFVIEDGVTGSARQLNLLLVQQSLRAWCVAYVSRQLGFLLLFGCCLGVVVVVHVGHADGDNSCRCCIECTTLDSCAGRQNVAVCVHCACFVAIDTHAAIFVIVVWVLSWYSQRSHDALVAFVNKAALWLWGWLPRPSSLHVRGSSRERFGISWWFRWSRPSRLAMSLLPVVDGCNSA